MANINDSDIAIQIEKLGRKARYTLIAGAALVLICFISAIAGIAALGILIILGLGGVVLLFLGLGHKIRLKNMVSENIVRAVLEEFFAMEMYSVNGHISDGLIRGASLVRGWDRIEGGDYVKGTYKGLDIQFSDVRLIQVETKRDDKGDETKTETDIFRGPWLVCDFGRRLPESLPHEKEKKIPGGRLYTRVDGSRVHIAINNGKDLFEVSTKASEFRDLERLREKFRAEIRCFTDIIDGLMQNDKLNKE